jgi:hypothetical protein
MAMTNTSRTVVAMNLKCPHCHTRGKSGRAFDPTAVMVVGAQINGTTRSVIGCRRCGKGYLKSPLSTTPLPDAEWATLRQHPGFEGL